MMRKLAFIALLLPSLVMAEPIVTNSTTDSKVHTTGEVTTTLKSPPPSAISPSLSGGNTDSCTVGVAGAVQTQILGISAGTTTRDLNCERLKNAKTLYDMGMKVAAVSVLCQDLRVFDAMIMAGTPCPYNGIIGSDAKIAWENDEAKVPKPEVITKYDTKEFLLSVGGAVLSLLLFL
tara:strand:- start:2598 stop:3128 length:531 start_codon:yes stop_codon:yes gene_type:complete